MSEIPFGKAPRPSIDFGSTTKDENDQPCCAGCSPDVLVDNGRPEPDIMVSGDGTRYASIKTNRAPQRIESFYNPVTGNVVEYFGNIEEVNISAKVGSCKTEGVSDCVPSSPCSFVLTIKIKIIQSASTTGSNGSNILVPTIAYTGTWANNAPKPIRSSPVYGNIGNGRFLFDDNGNPSGYCWDSFIQTSFSIGCGEQYEIDAFDVLFSVPGSLPSSEILHVRKNIKMICTSCFSTSSEV